MASSDSMEMGYLLDEFADSGKQHDSLVHLNAGVQAGLHKYLEKLLRGEDGNGEDPAELPPHIDPRSPGSVALKPIVELSYT